MTILRASGGPPAVLRRLLLLCLLSTGFCAVAGAAPFTADSDFDQQRVATTVAAALAFMAPRTLDASTIPQLSIWGLRGLTTLDPNISAELNPTGLRLFDSLRPVMIRPPPPDTDAVQWGEAVAQMAREAWDASSEIRRAGTQAVISSFFDEVFNHLDPYSRYAPPAEAQDDRARRRGRAGVGLQAASSRTGFVVASIVPDGPAARAGIRVGDALLAIDGETLQDEDLDSVRAPDRRPAEHPDRAAAASSRRAGARGQPGARAGAARHGVRRPLRVAVDAACHRVQRRHGGKDRRGDRQRRGRGAGRPRGC